MGFEKMRTVGKTHKRKPINTIGIVKEGSVEYIFALPAFSLNPLKKTGKVVEGEEGWKIWKGCPPLTSVPQSLECRACV